MGCWSKGAQRPPRGYQPWHPTSESNPSRKTTLLRNARLCSPASIDQRARPGQAVRGLRVDQAGVAEVPEAVDIFVEERARPGAQPGLPGFDVGKKAAVFHRLLRADADAEGHGERVGQDALLGEIRALRRLAHPVGGPHLDKRPVEKRHGRPRQVANTLARLDDRHLVDDGSDFNFGLRAWRHRQLMRRRRRNSCRLAGNLTR